MATRSTQDFCDNYLEVDAIEATLYDILCILICSTSSLNDRKFYNERSEYTTKSTGHRNLRRRWLIFVSVVIQKLFIWGKKPLALVGSLIEMWLNLLSSNGGLFKFLLNLLQDKVVKPEKSTFTSLIGELDRRQELEKGGGKGDNGRYKSSLSMMAAKLSYENEAFVKNVIQNHWKMKFIGFGEFWNDYQNQFTTYATMFQDTTSDPNLIVVAFRGTRPFDADDWRTDFDISWYQLKHPNNGEPIGNIHGGFMKALGLQHNTGWPKELQQDSDREPKHPFAYYKIRETLREILEKNENAKFILTGHSLGGALAILFVGVLGLHEETWLLERLEGVYTFGQPRVGDERFGQYMKKLMKERDVRYFRYVYSNDMVPRLPYDDKTLLFKHFGQCLYYNSFYNGQVLEEEPNRNYFSLGWVIPKYTNAAWEIIRSFVLPYWEGKEYKERWTERVFRLVGLVIPGIAAHGPTDYLNVTLLGPVLVNTIHDTSSYEEAATKKD